MAATNRQRLSVIVPATRDSSSVRTMVETLGPELDALGGELLIADGSLEGIRAGQICVHLPGADVFTLRAEAAKRAQGSVVALTEDHCAPSPGWCKAIIRAHQDHPEAAAIAGPVKNGSTTSALDWANFLLTFAPFLPPLPPHGRRRVPPVANISLKREVLDEHDLPPGRIEMELIPHLHRTGRIVYDDQIGVHHVQSSGSRAFSMHFHNGRSTTGLPHRHLPVGEILIRTLQAALLPPRLLTEVVLEVFGRRAHRRVLIRAAPLILLLAYAHAFGEIVGVLRGPGQSPQRLE